MMMDRRMAFSLVLLLSSALVVGLGGRAWAEENDATSVVLNAEDQPAAEILPDQTLEAYAAPAEAEADVDPWEGFNEPMFRFNKRFDEWVLKPVATGWDRALPDSFQRGLHNAIDNLAVVRRSMNNLFQGKFQRAGRELARFTINSTIGYVGFLDVAKDYFGLQQADEDFGQTLAVWGAKSGPYLVLPFSSVSTVRDTAGEIVDALMYPISWVAPFGASAGIFTVDVVNERSLNLDRYQRVEESVVDLYSAVRNAYFQRRAAAIRE
jgi:phospholipid-binding lipoprotein MlaA